ncbi:hypothetical protein [Paraburkholderia sp. GAS82]|uniref:hypothetical protein n=1 Tax=Paraburkholderia sp. GAS82 TaxID=3035137 RepID=UPI003D21A784
MTTQLNWTPLCQTQGNGATAIEAYGPVPNGSQVSITAASAWNPTGASSNAVVDVFIVPSGESEGDPTHVDRVSVPPGAALPLANAINHKLVGGGSIWLVTNGATVTISGAVAS